MKPHYTDLTQQQQATYGDGCGVGARLLNVPDFIFTASCRHHDFNYERGGGLRDKLRADWDFYGCMIQDAANSTHRGLYTLISTVYWLGVTILPLSYVYYTWGRWRTIEEILARDDKRKAR